eukprot:Gb_13575 [translate_table: standard]
MQPVLLKIVMAATGICPLFMHLFVHLFILSFASAQRNAAHNIALGSKLEASKNSTWVSPSGEFAFGFYSTGQSLYLLGIWFDRIPDKTLVWAANRDSPVDGGSTLELTESGNLNLFDSKRNNLWSPDRSALGVVTGAAMLNNGNFVLLNSSSQPLWQSFESPTDTLLPGQTLNWKSSMYSKASVQNYSSGRFALDLQEDGNLVLYPSDRRGESQGAYWASGTNQGGDNPMTLKFDQSGLLYLVNSTNATTYTLTDGTAGSGQILRRVTLDTDGILRQYVWSKNDTNSWTRIWRVVDDPCKDVKSQCGINGICILTSDLNPDCKCPPGFFFIDGSDHFKGCDRNNSFPRSCSASSRMDDLENTDWYNGADYEVLTPFTESQCKNACLDDCNCIVAIFGHGNYCWKKRIPLIDGRQGTDITNKALVKVSDDIPSTSDINPLRPPDKRKESRVVLFIGISLVGCSAILFAAALLTIWWCGHGLIKNRILSQDVKSKVPEGLKAYTYKEIHAATGGFKEQLGMGAFGTVYKGLLPDGRPIAVKKLDKLMEEGENEFRTEMNIIGTTHHKHLVQLYGFCDEGSERLLVYEYMCKGSLDTALFAGDSFLSWNLRVQIAIGTARGILYLHEECRSQIIHCDIKPQNILLDDNYITKISDFGLAKLMSPEKTRTFTRARGTKGYVAPEWHRNMAITVKVDVYSFGMMLCEIICCRKNLELDAPDNEIVLSDWVYECFKYGRLVKLVEQQQSEENRIEIRLLERMVLVGLWCIQEDPSLRPPMKKVVQMLEGTVEIAVPPAPKSFISSL